MNYLKFSNKFIAFFDIINDAFYDVVFFTLMQMIIMFGYSLMCHILFGIQDEQFSSIGESIFSLFLMMVGSKSILEIETNNKGVLIIVAVSFMVIVLLLLNMLVAIYASHYISYYENQGTIDTSLLSKILNLFFDIGKLNDQKAH